LRVGAVILAFSPREKECYPREDYGVVILPPEEQEIFVAAYPSIFSPVRGCLGTARVYAGLLESY